MNTIKDFNQRAPVGINQGFLSVNQDFAIVTMKDFLLLDVIIGIVIGLGVATIVLFVFLRNMMMSLVSLFCILKMLLFMFSAIFLTDRQFNISESISIIVFLPYTVEYVVWIAHSYTNSSGESLREDRMAMALRT